MSLIASSWGREVEDKQRTASKALNRCWLTQRKQKIGRVCVPFGLVRTNNMRHNSYTKSIWNCRPDSHFFSPILICFCVCFSTENSSALSYHLNDVRRLSTGRISNKKFRGISRIDANTSNSRRWKATTTDRSGVKRAARTKTIVIVVSDPLTTTATATMTTAAAKKMKKIPVSENKTPCIPLPFQRS